MKQTHWRSLPSQDSRVLRATYRVLASIVLLTTFGTACQMPGSSSDGSSSGTTTTSSSTKYIYIASGTTYAGLGTTVSTPSNSVVRYKENGGYDGLVVDYTNSPNDTPVALANYDSTYLLVLVENAAGRRIDKVAKDGSSYSTFLTNAAGLTAQVRSLFSASDGGFLVSKGTAIEKFSSNKSRILQGANPYVNNPAGTCATTATLIPRAIEGPSSTIVYLHAAATPNNKIVLIKQAGYSVAGDCLAGLAGPTVNHYPTSALLHSSGKLLVSYSNTTGPVNDIYSYAVTATTIPAGVAAYTNQSIISGVTYMAEMDDTTVLVASGASTFNTIEKFTFTSGTNTLARVGTTAYIPASLYTKSISAILIAN